MSFFGVSPRVKLIDFFLANRHDSFCLTEIYARTGVTYGTIKLVVPDLCEQGILIIKKSVGKIKFYQIDKEKLFFRKALALRREIDRGIDRNGS